MEKQNKALTRVATILLIPTLVFSVVFSSLAVGGNDFGHTNNLSRTSKNGLVSGPPEAAAKGSRVAVVWSDGFNTQPDTKEAGHIYLMSADVAPSKNYWRAKTFVLQATNNVWGLDPDFVFDQSNANILHIVWSQANSCGGIIFNCKFQTIVYRQCNITNDVNTCGQVRTVATAPTGNTHVNPSIAQDDDGQLHVIWQRDPTNQFFYSRSVDSGVSWSAAGQMSVTPAPAASSRDPKIFASNNRLHVVWDNQPVKEIRYFFDGNDDDNTLTGTSRSFTGGSSYTTGDPGHPTITGRGKWLFIAYDVVHPSDNTKFAPFYAMSVDGGSTWTSVFNIPEKPADYPVPNLSSPQSDLGLKPSLILTSTGNVTRAHVVWNESVNVAPPGNFPAFRYRIYFSDVTLTGAATVNTEWSPPISVTNSVESSTSPAFFITEPPNPSGHVAYQEEKPVNNSTAEQFDVLYEGGISGTTDPDYVIDEFDFEDDNDGDDGQGNETQFKTVTPKQITAPDPNGLDLNYVIFFENEGNLTAVGITMTDVLPAGTVYNNNVNTTGGLGQATYNSGTNRITWSGNVPPGGRVRITFSVKLTNIVPPKDIINTATLASIGTGGQPFATSRAVTRAAATVLGLPLIRR